MHTRDFSLQVLSVGVASVCGVYFPMASKQVQRSDVSERKSAHNSFVAFTVGRQTHPVSADMTQVMSKWQY